MDNRISLLDVFCTSNNSPSPCTLKSLITLYHSLAPRQVDSNYAHLRLLRSQRPLRTTPTTHFISRQNCTHRPFRPYLVLHPYATLYPSPTSILMFVFASSPCSSLPTSCTSVPSLAHLTRRVLSITPPPSNSFLLTSTFSNSQDLIPNKTTPTPPSSITIAPLSVILHRLARSPSFLFDVFFSLPPSFVRLAHLLLQLRSQCSGSARACVVLEMDLQYHLARSVRAPSYSIHSCVIVVMDPLYSCNH